MVDSRLPIDRGWAWVITLVKTFFPDFRHYSIEHVNEYLTMYYFGNPRQTLSQ